MNYAKEKMILSNKRVAFVATKLKQCLRANTEKSGVKFETLFNGQ